MIGLSTPPIGQTLTDGSGNMTRSWTSWMAQMYQWIKPQPPMDTTKNVQSFNSGDTYQFTNQVGALCITLSGTLAALTVALPPLPVDGQIARVASDCTITSFTLTCSSGQFIAASGPSTLVAGIGIAYIFNAEDGGWYPY